MPATFKMSKRFFNALDRLERGMEQAAHEGMLKAMQQAEDDARGIYRWRKPGTYRNTDKDGKTWEWEVTGLTAASLTGYVVSNLGSDKRTKALVAQRAARFNVQRDWMKVNTIDPSVTADYSPRAGKVLGVVTMYTAYAPFLQRKEMYGAKWGKPSAGEPVTVEVLRVNWDTYYVPRIIRPHIERIMRRIASSYT